jgi:hypothetical protein
MTTAAERSQYARLAAYAKHSRTSGREATAAANRGKMGRYMAAVDPDGVLDSAERSRRAELAMKEDMTRLAIRSAQARRSRKAKRHKS